MRVDEIELLQSPEHGIYISCSKAISDRLQDFFSEELYVLFELSQQGDRDLIYFGAAASLDSVSAVLQRAVTAIGECVIVRPGAL